MARQLTYSGNGTLKTWFAPSGLEQTISASLIANGYGVASLTLNNAPALSVAGLIGAVATAGVTWNYDIGITVNSADDEDTERVRQLLITNFSQWFDNVVLSLAYDTAASGFGNLGNLLSKFTGGGGSGTTKDNSSSVLSYVLIGGVVLIGFTFIAGTASGGRYRK